MVLAAGLGKRLRPVTIRTPKALIPVNGKPLLQWALDKLGRAGANPIYVNVHHHAPFVRTFLSQIETAEEIRVVEEDPVLETGGGIRNVARMMQSDVAGGGADRNAGVAGDAA
ncbi:MAG: NTP transferase domain-containing protein, partial [Gemmatimonadetes bacterium]|nr:NTP transferase domain-containing protein [Gemmatimonadota bacterium]